MKVEYLETTFDGTPCFSAWVDEHAELVGNGHTRESALDDLLKKREEAFGQLPHAEQLADLEARGCDPRGTTEKVKAMIAAAMEAEGVTPEDLHIPYSERP